MITGSELFTAISGVRSTLEAMHVDNSGVIPSELSPSGQFILGGSGFGIVKEDGELASPVTREMAQRMDDLFAAMSPSQRDDVADQLENTGGVVDLVGGLSAMGVFAMDGADPTDSNFMSAFDDLDSAAQKLVL